MSSNNAIDLSDLGGQPADRFQMNSAVDQRPAKVDLSDLGGIGLAEHEEGPSGWDAFKRGGKQGATFGLADEWSGLTGGGLQALAKWGMLDPGTGLGALGPGETGKDDKPLDVGDVYREYRDEYRADDAAARKAHPVAFVGGDLAGGLISGGGANRVGARLLGYGDKALKGIEALKAASLGGALGGAAQGAGSSTGDARQTGIDALKAAGFGAAIPLAIHAAVSAPGVARDGIEALRMARLPAGDRARALLQKVAESGPQASIETLPPEMRRAMISSSADRIEQSLGGEGTKAGASPMVPFNGQWGQEPGAELSGVSLAAPGVEEQLLEHPLKMPANEHDAIELLRNAGVPLSKGQQKPGGLMDKIEQAGMHSAFGGQYVSNVRGAGLEGWQNAALNEIRPIPGAVPPGSMAEKLDSIYKDFETAYAPVKAEPVQALGTVSSRNGLALAPLDKAFTEAVADPSIYATDAERASVAKWLSNQATPEQLGLKTIKPGESAPLVRAEAVLDLRHNIRTQSRQLMKAGRTTEGALLDRAEESLTGGLEQQLNPRASASLRETDAAYSRYKVLDDALARAGDQPQSFTPAQLSASIKASTDKSIYARGGGHEGLRALAAAGRMSIENRQPATGAKLLTLPFGGNHFVGPLAALANSPWPGRMGHVSSIPFRLAADPNVLLPFGTRAAATYGPGLLKDDNSK